MTNPIETMKAALLAAGKTVPEDASADDIELMHLELEAEQEAEADESPGTDGPTGPPLEIAVLTDPRPHETKLPYLSALARLQTPEAGSKTPAVIEWARANLSKKEFSERYPNLA